jgi:hypothetical protein
MQQFNTHYKGQRVSGWMTERGAAYGLVFNNTLHLLYTDDLAKKGFAGPTYVKVIKKAKAKFGVGRVVERADRAAVEMNGRLYAYEVGSAGDITELETLDFLELEESHV